MVRRVLLAGTVVMALQAGGAAAPQTPAAGGLEPLQISHRARAVAAGEVVLVDIRTKAAGATLREVQAQWLSQAVLFYQVEAGWWQGLAPVDLAIAAGRYTLRVRASATDGRTLEQPYLITIAPRTFPARRITVAPKFVDPPADELARIDAERKAAEAIFARQTRERLWSEPFVVPVPGAATSSFGRRTILNGQSRGQHTGTDFQAATGTPVVAPNRGRIALAADQYFPGKTIIIDHGLGVYSYLAHLSEFTATEGTVVERGQRIALSGATGRVTGPHLHWTMRFGSARVDPLSLVEVFK
jgi:murein DD-endopeptidase MepM/ murein hydrolase activator NlpD